MRFLAVMGKCTRETLRDLWVVLLSLVFAPCFVLLYWLFTAGGSTTYAVAVLNRDRAVPPGQESVAGGEAAVRAIGSLSYPDGKPLLRPVLVGSREEAIRMLQSRAAVAFLTIPEDFSGTIAAVRAGDRAASSSITFGGDLTNPYYMIGATLATTALDGYVQEATGVRPPLRFREEPMGGSATRTEFETYVPGILVVSVILMVFLSAMTIAREVEAGTLRRLQITRMRAFDLLGGTSAVLLAVTAASVVLTFLTAMALGFRSQGPLWAAALICCVTGLSVIGIGMLVAGVSRTVAQAFVISNFPLGLLMFFSGGVFPLPHTTLFRAFGHDFGPFDLIPATHAVNAMNKILNLGTGLGDVAFELSALLALSAACFLAGVLVFRRVHMRPA